MALTFHELQRLSKYYFPDIPVSGTGITSKVLMARMKNKIPLRAEAPCTDDVIAMVPDLCPSGGARPWDPNYQYTLELSSIKPEDECVLVALQNNERITDTDGIARFQRRYPVISWVIAYQYANRDLLNSIVSNTRTRKWSRISILPLDPCDAIRYAQSAEIAHNLLGIIKNMSTGVLDAVWDCVFPYIKIPEVYYECLKYGAVATDHRIRLSIQACGAVTGTCLLDDPQNRYTVERVACEYAI